MKKFRFAILGAGHIARQFCDAVSRIDGCEVCAVASKSLARAENFAKENGVESYYDDYETLLEKEKPDCAYIAVTTNDHYRLSALCVNHSVPVLCEKAMFQNSEEAKNLYALASEKDFCHGSFVESVSSCCATGKKVGGTRKDRKANRFAV